MDVENLKYYADTLERQARETAAAAAAFRATIVSLRSSTHLEEQWLKDTANELRDLAEWTRKLAAELRSKISM
jgi:hypothetical protein